MADTATAATDRGETTSLALLTEHVPLDGLHLVDVGCGGMAFSRQLAESGASVLAVDPDPVQAQQNRAAAPVPGLRFEEAGAAALPAADASLDGVVFSFSLHHVPEAEHAAAFAEARRVLKPGGFLCVIEPTGGPLNDVMRLFHDEDAERAAAWRALETLAVPHFASRVEYAYHSPIVFDAWEDFAAQYAGKTFNEDYGEADVRRPEVREAFERAGGAGFAFPSNKRMMLLREPTGTG